jgi:hypothetical protein
MGPVAATHRFHRHLTYPKTGGMCALRVSIWRGRGPWSDTVAAYAAPATLIAIAPVDVSVQALGLYPGIAAYATTGDLASCRNTHTK